MIAVLVISCKHEAEITESAANAEAPAELVYSTKELNLEIGASGSSVEPTIKGTTPIYYTISSEPSNGGKITIDEKGIIHISGTIAEGTYILTVVANNAAGSVVFKDIYKVTISKPQTAPANLVYSPNKLSLLKGKAGNSALPSIEGTAPITYTLTTTPATSGSIKINNEGIITVDSTLAAGTYNVTVQASNAAGSSTFQNVFTIEVSDSAVAPSELVYSPASLQVYYGLSDSSVVPTLKGTSPFTFVLSSVPNNGGLLSINNQGVITANEQLPVGTYSITVQVTNEAGSATFSEIYTVTVNAVNYVSFEKDIKPIIVAKCATCHTQGPQTIYTDYLNAKTDINLILDRIQRDPKDAGFMPKKGEKLSEGEINLFKQWLSDGLKER